MKKIQTPLTNEVIKDLKVGDVVLVSGKIYIARDAAHKRLVELMNKGEQLPFDLTGQIIYYAGPTPPKPGEVIGSVGPTTSYRMDPYSPALMDHGLKGMIGKGARSKDVKDSIINNTAVYFVAIGGAAVLSGKAIKKAEVIAYPELGAEAIREVLVEDFLVIVANDISGNDLYDNYKNYAK